MENMTYRLILFFLILCASIFQQGIAQNTKRGTQEAKAWEAVNSLERQSLQNFLKQFPDGEFAKSANLANELGERIDSIRESKVIPDFTIPFDMLGAKWIAWQKRFPQIGVLGCYAKAVTVIIDENEQTDSEYGCFFPAFSGGKTPRLRNLPPDEMGVPGCPTGEGSILAFRTDGVKYPFTRKDLQIETAGDSVVFFAVIRNKGLIHLKGTGRVTLPNGKTAILK